jgi:hypothetical protein
MSGAKIDNGKGEEERRKYVEAWNKTMLDIWKERIYKLKVIDTASLWRSPVSLPINADGKFLDVTLSQSFLEYGLWQDLGVGKEVPHGNPGDIGHDKVRKRRRWFSVKYFASVMNLKDFFAESIGEDFKGMFSRALDTDNLRYDSAFYKSKGYTR